MLTRYQETPFSYFLLSACILITLAGVYSTDLFDMLSANPDPDYFCQYFTFVFLHGVKGNAFAIVGHLLLNVLVIVNVAVLVEKIIGTRNIIFLSIIAWVGYLLTMMLTEVTVNGASGVVWSYSVVLFSILRIDKRFGRYSPLLKYRQEALVWLLIMWLLVTLCMIVVPFLFGSTESWLQAFVYGNIFHFQSVIMGFIYLCVAKPIKLSRLRRILNQSQNRF